jgi:hypothetical protein
MVSGWWAATFVEGRPRPLDGGPGQARGYSTVTQAYPTAVDSAEPRFSEHRIGAAKTLSGKVVGLSRRTVGPVVAPVATARSREDVSEPIPERPGDFPVVLGKLWPLEGHVKRDV